MDTDTRLADDFTLTRYLETADAVKVEAERFPLLAVVLRESFGTSEHQLMVAVHDIRVARFRTQDRDRSIAGDVNGDHRLALALAESLDYNAAHPKNGSATVAATLARHRIQQESNERETKK